MEMTQKRSAHGAGKLVDASSKKDCITDIITMVVLGATFLAALAVAYAAIGFAIDMFHGFLRAAVIAGVNPFGWS